ncbi:hypothetical protein CDAR_223971 [Caerostris darwini]|uniref:Uncharacterized protein n=1 Tax=Caerostris darwini TaxID=1538125 RepID=A0AAV4WQP0_9ARAC|nr:hypothetical protein CDAR_223971 [Caerostris darwini]
MLKILDSRRGVNLDPVLSEYSPSVDDDLLLFPLFVEEILDRVVSSSNSAPGHDNIRFYIEKIQGRAIGGSLQSSLDVSLFPSA